MTFFSVIKKGPMITKYMVSIKYILNEPYVALPLYSTVLVVFCLLVYISTA